MQSEPRAASTSVIHVGARKRLIGGLLGVVAVLFRWAGACARRCRPHPAAPAVLILEPFGMGDMISFEPLIRRLREAGREVRVCARPEWRVLFPALSAWVPACIPWGSHTPATKYRLTDYLKPQFRSFLKELRLVGRGCVGIDTRGDIRSVLLLYGAGCRRVVTLADYLGSDLRTLPVAAEQVAHRRDLRRWQINLLFLSALGIECAPEVAPPGFPHLAGTPIPLEAKRAGLVPVAPWPGKWWGPDRWTAVIQALHERGWEVQGLCGAGQVDLTRTQLGVTIPIHECASVEAWARELARCSVVVTLDTGPMHLADALGVPVVALFGQGLLPLWAPSGPRSRVLSHQDAPDFFPCHPIPEHIPEGTKFMRRITVEEVLAALRSLEG